MKQFFSQPPYEVTSDWARTSKTEALDITGADYNYRELSKS